MIGRQRQRRGIGANMSCVQEERKNLGFDTMSGIETYIPRGAKATIYNICIYEKQAESPSYNEANIEAYIEI
jgi:hypothetical protein